MLKLKRRYFNALKLKRRYFNALKAESIFHLPQKQGKKEAIKERRVENKNAMDSKKK